MAGLGRLALAALGIIAYQNRDKLSDWLSTARKPSDPNTPPSAGNPFEQIFGGASGPLGDLLERIRSVGRGDAVDSWVKKGPNEPITPSNVEAAIDEETLSALVRQTGLSREEILERLAVNLPQAVDDMTPEGSFPEREDSSVQGEPTLLDPISPNSEAASRRDPNSPRTSS